MVAVGDIGEPNVPCEGEPSVPCEGHVGHVGSVLGVCDVCVTVLSPRWVLSVTSVDAGRIVLDGECVCDAAFSVILSHQVFGAAVECWRAAAIDAHVMRLREELDSDAEVLWKTLLA